MVLMDFELIFETFITSLIRGKLEKKIERN